MNILKHLPYLYQYDLQYHHRLKDFSDLEDHDSTRQTCDIRYKNIDFDPFICYLNIPKKTRVHTHFVRNKVQLIKPQYLDQYY